MMDRIGMTIADLWRRRHELIEAEWLEAAPLLLGIAAANVWEAEARRRARVDRESSDKVRDQARAWLDNDYTGTMDAETMRFSPGEMVDAFIAGWSQRGFVAEPLPGDVVRLVIAARAIAFGELRDMVTVEHGGLPGLTAHRDAMIELDAASEAFASRVRWEDEPSDEEAAPEPTVHHGTINIDGQDHAIRLEIHETEGGLIRFDGSTIEDDGFVTLDLTGLTGPKFGAWPKNLVIEPKRPAIPMIDIPAPADLSAGMMVNGVLCVPLAGVTETILAAAGARDRHDCLAAVRRRFSFCAKCGGKPVITNLDGDDLCSPCATKWVVGEGQAERDRQDAEEGEANG